MIKSILKFSLLGLLAIGVTGTPIVLHAQDTATATTNKPATSTHGVPFRGKVKAIDSTAMTITVGARTFQITSATKINKNGKPATLADGAVGDNVSGYMKKTDDGKWDVLNINFGPKPKPAASNTTTNTP